MCLCLCVCVEGGGGEEEGVGGAGGRGVYGRAGGMVSNTSMHVDPTSCYCHLAG